MPEVVRLNGVTKRYDHGGPAALEELTLSIADGEAVAVMGPSGSGKSTLLNLIAGLDQPTSGTVAIAGVDLGGRSEAALARFRRRHIGMVFQFFNLLDELTVRDNVLLPAQLNGMSRSTARLRADELIAALSLADRTDAYPARLAGGEQQRVAIARALINRPTLILADEPTGAVDSATGAAVMRLLVDLNRSGHTLILVTHDAELARRSAPRIVHIADGRLVEDSRDAAPTIGALR
jgi:putative ABC transport system ATP-binding protein